MTPPSASQDRHHRTEAILFEMDRCWTDRATAVSVVVCMTPEAFRLLLEESVVQAQRLDMIEAALAEAQQRADYLRQRLDVEVANNDTLGDTVAKLRKDADGPLQR